jgi:hypothetical protein
MFGGQKIPAARPPFLIGLCRQRAGHPVFSASVEEVDPAGEIGQQHVPIVLHNLTMAIPKSPRQHQIVVAKKKDGFALDGKFCDRRKPAIDCRDGLLSMECATGNRGAVRKLPNDVIDGLSARGMIVDHNNLLALSNI